MGEEYGDVSHSSGARVRMLLKEVEPMGLILAHVGVCRREVSPVT